MSHILDALRRAESERRLGKPPDRSMIAGPLRAARRRRRGSLAPLPFILAAVLLLVSLLLAREWLASRVPAESAPETSAPRVAAPPSPDPRPAPAPVALPAPPAERELPRAKLAEAGTIGDMDALFAPEHSSPTTGDRSPTAPSTLAPRDALANVDASGRSADAAGEDEASEDLPSARSAGMPDFIIQVHAWSPEPEQRFVRVDDRRYREGDRLPNAARIEGITRDGIVLLWSGQRVRRGLDR